MTIVQGRRRLGQVQVTSLDAAYALEGNAWSTNCYTDAFYAQGPSPSSNPPMICGTNTGHHMYVEADVERGNKLFFSFSDMVTVQPAITRGVTTLATRAWDITISHIECTSLTLPPNGCTKYFWNAAGRAVLNNYNFVSGDTLATIHLAQQHERMCIRRERGKCVGCFSAATGDFDVSMGNIILAHSTQVNGCCGYATVMGVTSILAADNLGNGNWNAIGGQIGWDCIIIPGAYMHTNADEGTFLAAQTTALLQQVIGTTTGMNNPQGPQICGAGAGIGPGGESLAEFTQTVLMAEERSLGETTNLTVCTRNQPFTLEFMSDDLEGIGNADEHTEFWEGTTNTNNQGFNINFQQHDC